MLFSCDHKDVFVYGNNVFIDFSALKVVWPELSERTRWKRDGNQGTVISIRQPFLSKKIEESRQLKDCIPWQTKGCS